MSEASIARPCRRQGNAHKRTNNLAKLNPSTFPETSSPQSCQSASGLSRHSACGVFQKLGFKIYATEGTAKFYEKAGVKCEVVNKIAEGRPNVLDIILNKQVNLIINTPWAKRDAIKDDKC